MNLFYFKGQSANTLFFLIFFVYGYIQQEKKNKLIYILDLVRMKNNRLFQVGEYSTLLYFYFTLYMKCLQKMSQKFKLNSLSMALLFNVDNFENFQFLMCLYCLTHYISNIYYQREKSLFLLNKKKENEEVVLFTL